MEPKQWEGGVEVYFIWLSISVHQLLSGLSSGAPTIRVLAEIAGG